jgi:hypothetical protein
MKPASGISSDRRVPGDHPPGGVLKPLKALKALKAMGSAQVVQPRASAVFNSFNGFNTDPEGTQR